MALLIKEDILSGICNELSKCQKSIMIVSAYCKLPLIRTFDMNICAIDIEKILLVRLRPEDILSGASDLELYPYCKTHGWKMYFRLDLHAKTYVFDHVRCIIGSANATGHGMNLSEQANYEMATTCLLAERDVRNLKLLLKGAVEMTDAIYDSMKQIIDHTAKNADTSHVQWPNSIVKLACPDYSLLFSEDFPTCSSPMDASTDDLLFLNGNPSMELATMRECLETSKCYQWLKNLIDNSANHEMYFGSISAQLHNQLLDEPKPYRKDVKEILSNLLNWISILQCTQLVVDRPNHSQRVRLRK